MGPRRFAKVPKDFRLTELLTLRGTTKLQHLLYSYDPVGNITDIQAGVVIFGRGQKGTLSVRTARSEREMAHGWSSAAADGRTCAEGPNLYFGGLAWPIELFGDDWAEWAAELGGDDRPQILPPT